MLLLLFFRNYFFVLHKIQHVSKSNKDSTATQQKQKTKSEFVQRKATKNEGESFPNVAQRDHFARRLVVRQVLELE